MRQGERDTDSDSDSCGEQPAAVFPGDCQCTLDDRKLDLHERPSGCPEGWPGSPCAY